MSRKDRDEEISELLRQAVRDSGLSELAIAKRAGIDQSQLNRFQRKERGLTLASASKVADALGLKLTLVPKVKKGK